MFETLWEDNQGDIWAIGDDGLMHSPETRPFPREYVEKKWGPLREVTSVYQARRSWKRCAMPTCREFSRAGMCQRHRTAEDRVLVTPAGWDPAAA